MSDTFTPPVAAQRNAQRVLRWREEHPDEIRGMTSVGWLRASQLASGRPISLDIVKRMAQFNRHRPNARVAQEHVKAPWRDAGRVAWLGWGGDEGIDWARKISAETETKAAGATPTGVMGHGPGGAFSVTGLGSDEETVKEFDQAAVIIPLWGSATGPVQTIQRVFAPEDLTGPGIETEPHITVALLPADANPERLAAILKEFGPFDVCFTGVSLFERQGWDVVKVDVESGDLRELQARLALAYPQEGGYLIYRPHVTLAYVRSGTGKRYLFDPLPGATMRVAGVLYSPPQGDGEWLPLGDVKAGLIEAAKEAQQTVKHVSHNQKTHGQRYGEAGLREYVKKRGLQMRRVGDGEGKPQTYAIYGKDRLGRSVDMRAGGITQAKKLVAKTNRELIAAERTHKKRVGEAAAAMSQRDKYGFTTEQARYAKGKLALYMKRDNSGFESTAGRLAQGVGGRYSKRERAYIVSPGQEKLLKKLVDKGYSFNPISKTFSTESGGERLSLADVRKLLGDKTSRKSADEPTQLHNGQHLPASAFLVVEDPKRPSTWHLPVRGEDGKPDRRLMGAAKAALTVGFRGQTYSGPQKGRALAALKRMYAELDSAETTKPEVSPGPSIKAPDIYEALKKRGMSKASAAAISNAVAARRHKGGAPPSLVVFKDKRGDWRWVSISSSAFRDRDGEIVSTKALADDCARADKDGNYGVLRFWHMPGVDLGDCDFNVLRGRVLIESGTFRSPLIAQRVAEKSADYQISLGFRHPVEQPGKDGVFTTIRRFERSLVPIGRASNPFTSISVKRS